MDDKAQDLININKQLTTVREGYKATWDDVGKFINIARQQVTVSGQKTTTELYTSHVLMARGILQAGLYSYLTSPYLPWVRIKMQDEDLNKEDDVKRWLDNYVTPILYRLFAKSNIYSSFSEYYGDIISFCGGCIFTGEGKNVPIYADSISPYEFNFARNADGVIDTVYRDMSLTARQVQGMFPAGTVFNDKIMEILAGRSEKMYTDKFPFLHVVMPRDNRIWFRKDNKNLPFASYYIDVTAKEIVEESGYHEFPFSLALWSTNNLGTYGECPGTIALPDSKTSNKRKKLMLSLEEKRLNPPLDIPEGYKGRINTSPGGLNYRQQGQDRIEKLNIDGNFEYTVEMLKFDLEQIDDVFYVPVFRMLAQIERQMTAYEVSKRESERMLSFGPILGNLLRATDNLIIRTFNIATRMGLIPPPPQIAAGQEYEIEYVSPLARAQKAAQANDLQEALAFLMPLASVKPQILDNLDEDELYRYVMDMKGCPTYLTVPPKERDKAREIKAQMMEQQAMLDAAQQGADTMGSMEKAVPGSAQRMIGA